MNTIGMAFMFILVLIILIIVLSYASTASVDLKNLTADADLKTAKQWIDYALILTWPIWIGIILGLIALFVFGPELIPELGKPIVYFGVIVVLLSIALLALCCVVGLYYIWVSTNTDPSKAKAQSAAETASALSVFTLLFIFGVWWVVYRTPKVPHPDEYPSDKSSEYDQSYDQGQYPEEPYPQAPPPPYAQGEQQAPPPYAQAPQQAPPPPAYQQAPPRGPPAYQQAPPPRGPSAYQQAPPRGPQQAPQQAPPRGPPQSYQQRGPPPPQSYQRQSPRSYQQPQAYRQSAPRRPPQPYRRPIRTPISRPNPVAPPRGKSLVSPSNISRFENFAAKEAGTVEKVGVEAAEVAA